MTGIAPLRTEDGARTLLRVGLGVFLLSPYLIWLFKAPGFDPSGSAWIGALRASLAQAFFSALGAMLVGAAMFLGFQSCRRRALAEMSLLLPNMVPPLFLILGLMNLITPFVAFPYGVGAVVFAHVILNAGLVAIALDGLVRSRLGGIAESSWLMGVSRSRFWARIGIPVLRADLACLFLFVFSICFTSFSIPLILGGDRGVTLEVVIYDTIRVEGRWDHALMLAALQSAGLFVLALLLPRSFWPNRSHRPLAFLGVPWLKLAVYVPTFLLTGGWLMGLGEGLAIFHVGDFGSAVVSALVSSLALALGVGLAHVLVFLLIAFVAPHPGLDRFLNGYLAPSPVITGFAFLLLPGEGQWWSFAKLVVALTLITLPLLYRWIVHSALAALSGQVRTARLLGASWAQIAFEIVWPQISVPVFRACGLAALWASGDFALSAILSEDVQTLPLIMQDLIGNYRMEAAQVLMLPLLAVGLGAYFFFKRVGRYVTR